MNNCGIYYIFNSIANKGYIGSSKKLQRRFKEHLRDLKKGNHRNKHLQHVYNKYGIEVLQFKILCTCPEEYQYKLEQWFLSKSEINHSYNICTEVLTPPKVEFTEEVRKNMSLAAKARASSEEERVRLSKVAKEVVWGNPEHRKYMQKINKGQNHPQAKISEETAFKIKKEIFSTAPFNGKRKEICKKYGITEGMYKSILQEKSWKFLKV